jgi:hypothetical protein
MEERHACVSRVVDPAFRALMIRYFKDLSVEFHQFLDFLPGDLRSKIESPLSRLCKIQEEADDEDDQGEKDDDEGQEGRSDALQARN